MWKKITEFCNHERYQVIAGLLCVLLTVWGLNCGPKVRSISDPTKLVTRDELNAEVDHLLANVEIRYKDLDRQDEFRELVVNKVLLWTQTGQFSPIGLIPTLIGLFGIGAVTDNVRKRLEIKRITNAANSKNGTG